MRRALNINLLPSTLALAVSMPIAGYVQAQEIELNIPAQSLGSALQEFGRQTNVQVLYSPGDVQGKNSPAVKGKMQPQQAINALLAGSQTTYNLNGNTLTVTAAGSGGGLELSPTQVTGNMLGNVTENTGSYTPGSIATATRLVLTPKETPQSVTVVTRQHMDDFGLNSVDDVMRHTPGITVSAFDTERSNYYARGFSINNFQYDGIPSTARNVAYSAGNTLSDMAIYDRVEVLKGATGLLTGAGSLGATINLVRKKPTSEFQGHATLGAGSWDNYRSELDVSGPLTETGNIRGRAVAAYQDKHSFMDRYERKSPTYYGIMEFDLSPDTLLTVGGDYQDSLPKGSSWSGSFPLIDAQGNRNDVKRSFNNAADWSSWEQYTRTVFAMLEHDLGDGWITKLQLDHKINGYHALMGSIQGDTPGLDGKSQLTSGKYTGETVSDSADLYVSGPFSLGGREHELVFGGSISASEWNGNGYWNLAPNLVDFNNWHGNAPQPDWGKPQSKIDDTVRQTGMYMTTRLNLADDLKLLLGGRVVNYTVTGYNPTYRESGRFVPYVGAVYDLNDTYSVYASYTDIFMPQESYNRDRDNKLLEPDEGQNWELGVKADFLDGRVNASAAYFEIHEDNRSVSDDDYNNLKPTPSNYAFKGTQAVTKGYELEMSGELAPGWQLQAGYTHKIVRDDKDVKISTFEPEDQVSLYTTYKLKGNLDKLTVGGGARWQSVGWQNIYNSPRGGYEEFSQEAYWLVDLMTRYQFTKNVSATLNINNVFDKSYYTNIGFYNSAAYGEPRNFMLSTRWDF
ncbi:MAG: ligand-gated channel [Pseudomonadales bacterium RIFCSPLOWO2_12_60_38]|jgi:outer membrane receptor for ferric coprogen and ferric-rhodotorulic acid|nr:ligand-gated channel [Pseudomonas fluorescens FH5]MCF5510880.1 TonB-dependent siderophore receptor [Pseudomonas sp. PA-3-6H]MCF5560702.1 TonB-dependent siderophore receptor [Pseudomonas sp. PA-3-5D]MCF5567007.1 TonB-dependent siderophore receptor [Pseudomonas sp. PA-3-11C]MCF5593285.1 TonB-dependent siderophore receptor [Pseudomonas sp. PA-3-10C]NHC54424.1 TonB-dependent siderophore receptor [Pseudomonas sp. AU8050]NLT86653.1 TonB-dependent siderophore receptor [Pseudomonas lactis]OHC3213